MIYHKNKSATIFLSLAVLTRELFILPMILFFILSIFKKDKPSLLVTGLPILGFGIFYLFHQSNILKQLKTDLVILTLNHRFHYFDIQTFQKMISFSMRNFVFFGQKTHYLFFMIGLIGLLIAAIKNLNYLTLFLSALLFILVLPMVAVYDNDYWGIVFMPLILMAAPYAVLPFIKK